LAHIPKSKLPILPVLAEQAFPHQLIEQNLQRFETFLADTAECVLIFVESVGAYAETGLFAALDRVAAKTLIVNTKKATRTLSFLNQGPIRLIRKNSLFDEVFVLDRKVVRPSDAREILSKITHTLPKYTDSLPFDPKPKFPELSLRLQIASVYLAVRLLRAGDLALLTSVFRVLFKAVGVERIEAYLSLLVSFGLIERHDDIYYNLQKIIPITDLLITKQSFQPDVIKALTLEWHGRHSGQTAIFLRDHGVRT
jgi:hypothetical protein